MGLQINGVTVAEPANSGVQISEEPIWSEKTGRDVNSGSMIGDIVAWKRTVAITWPPLTFAQVEAIKTAIGVRAQRPFFSLAYTDSGGNTVLEPITVYSGNLEHTIYSISNAYKRQTPVTVTFIER